MEGQTNEEVYCRVYWHGSIRRQYDPIASLWVFIVGPLVGGALAAVTYKSLKK
jgi:glycerol uptake facilitator-like aquaporin